MLGAAVPNGATVTVLKDMVRQIGLAAATGKAVRVDMAPLGTMNIVNCRASFAFGGKMAASGMRAASAVRPSTVAAAPGTTAAGTPLARSGLVPKRPSEQQPHHQVSHSSRTHGVTLPEIGASHGSDLARPPTAPVGAPNDEATPAYLSHGYSRRGPRAGSPFATLRYGYRYRDEIMDDCREAVNPIPAVTVYKKHGMKKGLFRNLRESAYREILNQDLEDKNRRKELEAEADRRQAAHFRELAREAQEKAIADARERRAEADRVLQMNRALAESQKAQQLPRAQEPGDVFSDRATRLVPAKDMDALARQVEEKQRRGLLEQELDRQQQENARREAANAREDAEAAAQRRRDLQAEMRDACLRQMDQKASKAAAEGELDRALARTYGLAFTGENGSQFADRTKRIQRENGDLMRQRALDAAAAHEAEVSQRGIAEAEQKQRDARLAAERDARDARAKADLRASWDESIANKQRRRALEREAKARHRDDLRIQNPSSDEEDEL
jgi:hypothetical protein